MQKLGVLRSAIWLGMFALTLCDAASGKATGPGVTIVGPLDADGDVRVHEQGTADVNVTNAGGDLVQVFGNQTFANGTSLPVDTRDCHSLAVLLTGPQDLQSTQVALQVLTGSDLNAIAVASINGVSTPEVATNSGGVISFGRAVFFASPAGNGQPFTAPFVAVSINDNPGVISAWLFCSR